MDAELTGREREVLELLANGMRPKQIARELVISPKTVASHLQSVLGKLGVHSRAEAIAIAYREGFVGPLDSGDSRPYEGEGGSGGKAIASASSRTSESNGAAT